MCLTLSRHQVKTNLGCDFKHYTPLMERQLRVPTLTLLPMGQLHMRRSLSVADAILYCYVSRPALYALK